LNECEKLLHSHKSNLVVGVESLEDPLKLCHVLGIVLPHVPVARQVHPRKQQQMLINFPKSCTFCLALKLKNMIF
jgi:hypothetical protein